MTLNSDFLWVFILPAVAVGFGLLLYFLLSRIVEAAKNAVRD